MITKVFSEITKAILSERGIGSFAYPWLKVLEDMPAKQTKSTKDILPAKYAKGREKK